MKVSFLSLALAGFLVFISCVFLFPNSFGNNPDLIEDESYFLTSSLSAIQKHTLPGWEFSPSGAYYGGVQTYLDTAALIPVIAVAVVTHSFSLAKAQVWLALHTGDLLQVLRIVNALVFLLCLLFIALYLKKRRAPHPLVVTLLTVFFLAASSSLTIGLLHTNKVWAISLVLDAFLGALFLIQEYYRNHEGTFLMSKERYVSLLVWGTALAFLQSFVGVASAGLWVIYALLLRHIKIRDLIEYLKRTWYWILLLFVTQISFIYRGFFARVHPSLLDFGGNSTRTASASIDWYHRLADPLLYAVQSEPLILLYIPLALFALFKLTNSSNTRKIYILIGVLHPVFVWLIFYGLIGFSLFPRYALMLVVASAFSIALLADLHKIAKYAVLAISALLFLIVGLQTIRLYWQDSSAKMLEKTVLQIANDPKTTVLIDASASRLYLPLNKASIEALPEARKTQSRFQFLASHLESVDALVPLRSVVRFIDPNVSEDQIVRTAVGPVWVATQDCTKVCKPEEKDCLTINLTACKFYTTEDQKEYPVVARLSSFLREQELGITYTLRKVH